MDTIRFSRVDLKFARILTARALLSRNCLFAIMGRATSQQTKRMATAVAFVRHPGEHGSTVLFRLQKNEKAMLDPVLKVICGIRPLEKVEDVNTRLAEAGGDLTFDEILNTYPDLGIFSKNFQGVVSSVFFTKPPQGVVIDGIAFGDTLEEVLERFPTAEHIRRTDRADGTHCDSYVVDPLPVVQHGFTVEDGRVILQSLKVNADTQTAIKLFNEACNAPPFKDVWAKRTHGFLHKGDPDEQLRAWASAYNNDFHGNDWTVLADWLIGISTPADRHAFVLAYNWDHGTAPLAWIASQPDTCLATLAEMFWLAEPGYFEEHRLDPQRPVDTDIFDLLWELRDIAHKRVQRGSDEVKFVYGFDPGASAASHASDDPKSFFLPLFCHPIAGEETCDLSQAWPIPIN